MDNFYAVDNQSSSNQGSSISYLARSQATKMAKRKHSTDVIYMPGTYEEDDDKEYAIGKSPIIVKLPVSRDAIFYKMDHKMRGKCVILNHDTFDSEMLQPRKGSMIDVETITETFSNLGFTVMDYSNLPYEDIETKMIELSEDDHNDSDCICIFILTHGRTNGLIHARDYAFSLVKLWAPFTTDKCASLAGKPKLFFIQACRGSKYDGGTMVYASGNTSETDSAATVPYKIPTHADFLFAYSTVEGFSSWRDAEYGTWYIQCLCKVIQEYWETTDLLKMLTITARTVANDCTSTHTNPAKNNQKQMPSLTSTLTREVFFTKKK
ncbi:caspase-1 [Colletes latitarsis]|uniref:caspase-1 n=1 Tax=Colletes latitarsis TaxID=2605962 RepID=UPI0040365F04